MLEKVLYCSPSFHQESRKVAPKPVDAVDGAKEPGEHLGLDLWSQAFQKLRERKPDVAKSFEKLLREAPHVSGTLEEQIAAVTNANIRRMTESQWRIKWGARNYLLRGILDRIISAIQVAVKDLGGPLSNLDPIHIGIPFAGVCILLPLILSFSEQHTAAKSGLKKVTEITARWVIIGANFSETEDELDAHENLHEFGVLTAEKKKRLYKLRTQRRTTRNEALVLLYSKILEYQAIAASFFGKRTLERFSRAIPKLDDFTRLVQEITDKDKECLQLFVLWEIRTATRFQAAKYRDEENEKILRWLSDYQYGADHDHAIGKLVGTGKSSLMSMVVQNHLENLASTAEERIAYFYCTGKQSPSPLYVLRSLMAQLAWMSDGYVSELIRDVYAAANQISGSGKPDLERSVELTVALIENCPKVTIIVDALDECEESWSVVLAIKKIIELSSGRTRAFLTSRMQVEVDKLFHDCAILGPEENLDDVRTYIETEVTCRERRLLDAKRPDLEDRLIDVLTVRARNMFRWAELQLDTFLSSKSPFRNSKDVIHKLDLLEAEIGTGHPSLNQVYGEIYEMNTPYDVDRKLATKALRWLFLPSLPLQEGGPQHYREDQSYFSQMVNLVATNEDGTEDPDVTREYLLSICSNFIRVKQTSDGQKIEFAHFSVMEYLRSRVTLDEDGKNVHEYSWNMINAQVVETSLSYILSDMLVKTASHLKQVESYRKSSVAAKSEKTTTEQRIGLSYASFVTNPFSLVSKMPEILRETVHGEPDMDAARPRDALTFPEYAISFWPMHCRAAFKDQAPEGITKLVDKFFTFEFSGEFFKWWLLAFTFHHSHHQQTVYRKDFLGSDRKPSKVFTAAALGIDYIVVDVPEKDLQSRNLAGNTCLEVAARYCHASTVGIILDRGNSACDVKPSETVLPQNNMPRAYSALHAACRSSQLMIVDMLLRRMTNIETIMRIRDNAGRTPLLLATETGAVNLIDPLMRAGADVNAVNQEGTTSLWLAISALNVEAVAKLLLWKADPNIADLHGNTPLKRLWLDHFKELAGTHHCHYQDICSLLLDAGADIKVVDPDWIEELLEADDNFDENSVGSESGDEVGDANASPSRQAIKIKPRHMNTGTLNNDDGTEVFDLE
ncbi:hypothetical protein MMC17_001342 [Xylographa soralifera]|nr:hypothetical protein [Xylographa soralifera]